MLDRLFSGHAERHGALADALPVLNPDEMQHIAAALENAGRYSDRAVAGYLRDQLAVYAVSDGTRWPAILIGALVGTRYIAQNAASPARPPAATRAAG